MVQTPCVASLSIVRNATVQLECKGILPSFAFLSAAKVTMIVPQRRFVTDSTVSALKSARQLPALRLPLVPVKTIKLYVIVHQANAGIRSFVASKIFQSLRQAHHVQNVAQIPIAPAKKSVSVTNALIHVVLTLAVTLDSFAA